MRVAVFASILGLALVAVGTSRAQAPSSIPAIQAETGAADEECKLHFTPRESWRDVAICYNSGEREVWARLGPAYVPIFERYAKRRLSIAIAVDRKRLSSSRAAGLAKAAWDSLFESARLQLTQDEQDQIASLYKAEADSLDEQIRAEDAEIERLKVESRAAESEVAERTAEEQREIRADAERERTQTILLGIAGYFQARANGDAAASAAISAQPKITHTTCQPVFGTVQCTTTPY
jgi:hypothetical protein